MQTPAVIEWQTKKDRMPSPMKALCRRWRMMTSTRRMTDQSRMNTFLIEHESLAAESKCECGILYSKDVRSACFITNSILHWPTNTFSLTCTDNHTYSLVITTNFVATNHLQWTFSTYYHKTRSFYFLVEIEFFMAAFLSGVPRVRKKKFCLGTALLCPRRSRATLIKVWTWNKLKNNSYSKSKSFKCACSLTVDKCKWTTVLSTLAAKKNVTSRPTAWKVNSGGLSTTTLCTWSREPWTRLQVEWHRCWWPLSLGSFPWVRHRKFLLCPVSRITTGCSDCPSCWSCAFLVLPTNVHVLALMQRK